MQGGLTRRGALGGRGPAPLLAGVVGGAALAAGCSPGEGAPAPAVKPTALRFTFWSDEAELAHFERLNAIVRAKLPQISVASEVYEQGTDPHFAKLQVLFASGSAPDVTTIGPQNIPSFVKRSNGLLPLDDLVKRERFDLSDFWPRVMDLSRYKQALYTLPLGGGPNPLFYNPKHFREAGIDLPPAQDEKGAWTWDSFADAARRLTTREGDAFRRAGLLVDLNVIRIAPYIWSQGGAYFNPEQTKCLLAQPPALEAVQFLVDLGQRHRVGPLAGTPAPGIRWFPEQSISMQLQPMTSIYQWKQDPGFEFDVVANPKGKAGQVGLLNNWSCGILSSTPARDAAWAFLKELTGREAIAYYAGAGRAFPWRKSVAQTREYRDTMPLKSLNALFRLGESTGKTMPYGLGWIEFQNVGNATLREVGEGKVAVREGMERIAREADRILTS